MRISDKLVQYLWILIFYIGLADGKNSPCGGDLKDFEGTIVFRNYRPQHQDCTWNIQTLNARDRIRLKFNGDFGFESNKDTFTAIDIKSNAIMYKFSENSSVYKEHVYKEKVSTGNSVTIRLQVTGSRSHLGFNLTYTILSACRPQRPLLDLGGNFSEIISPNDTFCDIQIRPNSTEYDYFLVWFTLPPSNRCNTHEKYIVHDNNGEEWTFECHQNMVPNPVFFLERSISVLLEKKFGEELSLIGHYKTLKFLDVKAESSYPKPTCSRYSFDMCDLFKNPRTKYSRYSEELNNCRKKLYGGCDLTDFGNCVKMDYGSVRPVDQCSCDKGDIRKSRKNVTLCYPGLGSICVKDEKNCDPSGNLVCVNKRCRCEEDHQYDQIKGKCLGMIGARCQVDDNCQFPAICSKPRKEFEHTRCFLKSEAPSFIGTPILVIIIVVLAILVLVLTIFNWLIRQ